MSTTGARLEPDSHDHIVRPRAVKPTNPDILRAQGLEPHIHLNGLARSPSDLSAISRLVTHVDLRTFANSCSGRTTPVPEDAPPSAHSISAARQHIRAQNKRRMFPTVEYAPRVSHFDPKSEHRDFKGFFVLFWIGLAIMVITTGLRNIKDTGLPLRVRPWQLFTVKAWQLGLSDGAMVASSGLVLPLQQIFRRSKGLLKWDRLGMVIHSHYEALWFALWINWPFIFRWTWTAQVFLTLHTIVILMKMHSYAFYNGHLSATEARLTALNNPETASTAAAIRYPSSGSRVDESAKEATKDEVADDKAAAIESLRTNLATELTSPFGHVTFPQNLTLYNFIDYIFCPTLCYELEYPRLPQTQWMELFWKTLAVFGCIFLMTITSEEFIVPVLAESATRLEGVTRWTDQGLILAETISNLLFPFMVTFLLVFLVIFEYVLGAFAEITRFADRHFYSDWWNSSDWLEFSREWNIPVHNFLRRHVYSASIPYMPRGAATALTFFVSAVLHELIMGCITQKLRGYGFVAMMLQIPIVAVQRSPWIRGKKLFNVSFPSSSGLAGSSGKTGMLTQGVIECHVLVLDDSGTGSCKHLTFRLLSNF